MNVALVVGARTAAAATAVFVIRIVRKLLVVVKLHLCTREGHACNR